MRSRTGSFRVAAPSSPAAVLPPWRTGATAGRGLRPGAFGLSPAARAAAAARLETALGERPCSTHTERLEMVARAFGFRSWHAEKGRKT